MLWRAIYTINQKGELILVSIEELTGGPLTIFRVIKSHRMAAEWTQQQLADRLDVSKQAVSKFEKGLLLPSLEMVVKMADTFEVDRETFIRLLFLEMVDRAGLKYEIHIERRKAG